jgi:hypothetical protein
LDIAVHVDLADVCDADFFEEGIFLVDLEDITALADAQALGIEVEGSEVVSRGQQAANGGGFWSGRGGGVLVGRGAVCRGALWSGVLDGVAEGPGFVGEADGDERTAGALWAFNKRRGDLAPCCQCACLGEVGEGEGNEVVVDGDTYALFGGAVVDDALAALVAVIAQHEGLHGELDAIGFPGFQRAVGEGAWGAALVVDGGDVETIGFYEIQFGDEAVGIAGEGNGAGMELFIWGEFRRNREGVLCGVEATVAEGAFGCLGIVHELSVDPLVIEEPWAIDEGIEHAGWEVVGEGISVLHGRNSEGRGVRC